MPACVPPLRPQAHGAVPRRDTAAWQEKGGPSRLSPTTSRSAALQSVTKRSMPKRSRASVSWPTSSSTAVQPARCAASTSSRMSPTIVLRARSSPCSRGPGAAAGGRLAAAAGRRPALARRMRADVEAGQRDTGLGPQAFGQRPSQPRQRGHVEAAGGEARLVADDHHRQAGVAFSSLEVQAASRGATFVDALACGKDAQSRVRVGKSCRSSPRRHRACLRPARRTRRACLHGRCG